jgi:prefoldin subunit 5
MTDDTPLPDKVAHAYEQLKAAAAELNAVSGELGNQIAKIEETLQRLNIGVSTWVQIRGGDSDDRENYWFLEVGYAKVNSTWGVALRTRRGSYLLEEERTDPWLFGNAPRPYRAEAVDKLPELLAELTAAATKTTSQLREKVGTAQQIAKAFGPKGTAAMQARALSGDDIATDVAHALAKHRVAKAVTAADAHRAMLNRPKK